MDDISMKDLRALQSILNATIDAYETSPSPDATATINKTAKAIAALMRGAGTGTGAIGLGYLPVENMVVRIAIDLDLFNIIEENVTLEQLAGQTGADPNLLVRILRLLVATNIFTEPSMHVYSATPMSRFIRLPPIRDWLKTTFDTLLPIWAQIPGWLRENGYKDITSLENNPTVSLYGENFWEALAKDPKREVDFASAMKIQDVLPAAAYPQFPWEKAAATFDASKSDVFIVDVGGGKGQYLARIISEHPSLPGRKIVQDLASVVADVDAAKANFELTPHNFFMPQPVKGARYYHLRGILHDWPDESCLEILKHTKDACTPGYSNILIQTIVLPEYGVPRTDAANDVNMWTCIGKERTEKDWVDLLDKVGLKIIHITRPEAGFMSVMEVRPV